MAGYPRLSECQRQRYLGWTSKLYREGKTPEEIATITKRHISEVNEWIELVKKADEIRSQKNG